MIQSNCLSFDIINGKSSGNSRIKTCFLLTPGREARCTVFRNVWCSACKGPRRTISGLKNLNGKHPAGTLALSKCCVYLPARKVKSTGSRNHPRQRVADLSRDNERWQHRFELDVGRRFCQPGSHQPLSGRHHAFAGYCLAVVL